MKLLVSGNDLDLQPTTLQRNPTLAKVKIYPLYKNQSRMY